MSRKSKKEYTFSKLSPEAIFKAMDKMARGLIGKATSN